MDMNNFDGLEIHSSSTWDDALPATFGVFGHLKAGGVDLICDSLTYNEAISYTSELLEESPHLQWVL